MLKDYPDVLTTKEVQDILFIGKNTLYSFLNEGRIEGFRVGRHWRVSKDSMISYIKNEANICH
jgi:excisionase family DNA binding protein